MSKQCSICKVELDNPENDFSQDCGGDCLLCMAEAGDQECIDAILKIIREKGRESFHFLRAKQ